MGIAQIVACDEADSTNRIAREMIGSGCPAGTVVRAATQSGGRGQYGRMFSSPRGGLYFSLVLQPDLNPEVLPLITLATGVACRDIVWAETGLGARLKWPNDLYLADRKVGGILCESVPSHSAPQSAWVIVGVGLNVNSEPADFPAALRPLVTTLRACSGRMFAMEGLLRKLVTAIAAKVEALHRTPAEVLEQWQQLDYLLGKRVRYSSAANTMEGRGLGIGAEGGYLFQDDRGVIHTIIAGQVRLLDEPGEGNACQTPAGIGVGDDVFFSSGS